MLRRRSFTRTLLASTSLESTASFIVYNIHTDNWKYDMYIDNDPAGAEVAMANFTTKGWMDAKVETPIWLKTLVPSLPPGDKARSNLYDVPMGGGSIQILMAVDMPELLPTPTVPYKARVATFRRPSPLALAPSHPVVSPQPPRPSWDVLTPLLPLLATPAVGPDAPPPPTTHPTHAHTRARALRRPSSAS